MHPFGLKICISFTVQLIRPTKSSFFIFGTGISQVNFQFHIHLFRQRKTDNSSTMPLSVPLPEFRESSISRVNNVKDTQSVHSMPTAIETKTDLHEMRDDALAAKISFDHTLISEMTETRDEDETEDLDFTLSDNAEDASPEAEALVVSSAAQEKVVSIVEKTSTASVQRETTEKVTPVVQKETIDMGKPPLAPTTGFRRTLSSNSGFRKAFKVPSFLNRTRSNPTKCEEIEDSLPIAKAGLSEKASVDISEDTLDIVGIASVASHHSSITSKVDEIASVETSIATSVDAVSVATSKDDSVVASVALSVSSATSNKKGSVVASVKNANSAASSVKSSPSSVKDAIVASSVKGGSVAGSTMSTISCKKSESVAGSIKSSVSSKKGGSVADSIKSLASSIKKKVSSSKKEGNGAESASSVAGSGSSGTAVLSVSEKSCPTNVDEELCATASSEEEETTSDTPQDQSMDSILGGQGVTTQETEGEDEDDEEEDKSEEETIETYESFGHASGSKVSGAGSSNTSTAKKNGPEVAAKVEEKVSPQVEDKASPQVEEEASLKVDEESSPQVEEEASLKVDEEASLRLEEEASLRLEEEASPKVEEEVSLKNEDEKSCGLFKNTSTVADAKASVGASIEDPWPNPWSAAGKVDPTSDDAQIVSKEDSPASHSFPIEQQQRVQSKESVEFKKRAQGDEAYHQEAHGMVAEAAVEEEPEDNVSIRELVEVHVKDSDTESVTEDVENSFKIMPLEAASANATETTEIAKQATKSKAKKSIPFWKRSKKIRNPEGSKSTKSKKNKLLSLFRLGSRLSKEKSSRRKTKKTVAASTKPKLEPVHENLQLIEPARFAPEENTKPVASIEESESRILQLIEIIDGPDALTKEPKESVPIVCESAINQRESNPVQTQETKDDLMPLNTVESGTWMTSQSADTYGIPTSFVSSAGDMINSTDCGDAPKSSPMMDKWNLFVSAVSEAAQEKLVDVPLRELERLGLTCDCGAASNEEPASRKLNSPLSDTFDEIMDVLELRGEKKNATKENKIE